MEQRPNLLLMPSLLFPFTSSSQPGAVLPLPQETFSNSWRYFHDSGMLFASRGQRPGLLQNTLQYIEQPNLLLTAHKVTGLSLRNPDLSFKVLELTGTVKDFRHLGRTRDVTRAIPDRGDDKNKAQYGTERVEGPVGGPGPGAGRDKNSCRDWLGLLWVGALWL